MKSLARDISVNIAPRASNAGQAVPAAGYSPVVLSMSPRTVLAAPPFRPHRLADKRIAPIGGSFSDAATDGCHRRIGLEHFNELRPLFVSNRIDGERPFQDAPPEDASQQRPRGNFRKKPGASVGHDRKEKRTPGTCARLQFGMTV